MLLSRLLLNRLVINQKYIFSNPGVTSFKKFRTMAGDTGMNLNEIVEKMENFAPATLAEGWDNVGLLIDPMTDTIIKNIMLTNDLTENVIDEAKDKNVGLIISYHPPLFKALKTINGRTWKERLVIKCLRADIAVYSPHTSWDVVNGGVNDWLAKAFTVTSSNAITESGCGRKLMLSGPITIKEAVHLIKRHIEIPHVQVAYGLNQNEDTEITTVALCAGSGSTVLGGTQADLYLTGEMSHHEVLDAVQNNISVVLCNHSNTERGFLSEFAPELENGILEKKSKVTVSKVDKDPLIVV